MKHFKEHTIELILTDTPLKSREQAIADIEKMKQLNNCSYREVYRFLYNRFDEDSADLY